MAELVDCCNVMGCELPIHAKGMCHLHYRQMLRASRPKTVPCECGCGQMALRRFVTGHNTRAIPPEEQARRGTFSGESRRRTGTGYVKVHQRHEHRSVAEAKVGRPLAKGEVVHHKDHDKQNNHPDNLEVLTKAEHLRVHRAEMMAARKEKRGY